MTSSRIELFACAEGAPVVGPEDRDVVTAILQGLAVVPFTQRIFFGPLHTCDLGEPISSNSEMTGFLFAVPEGVDIARLEKAGVQPIFDPFRKGIDLPAP
jgi:hypothetical protein